MSMLLKNVILLLILNLCLFAETYNHMEQISNEGISPEEFIPEEYEKYIIKKYNIPKDIVLRLKKEGYTLDTYSSANEGIDFALLNHEHIDDFVQMDLKYSNKSLYNKLNPIYLKRKETGNYINYTDLKNLEVTNTTSIILVTDFVVDYNDYISTKVCVKGNITAIGEMISLVDIENSMTYINLDIDNLPRNIKKTIMRTCNDQECIQTVCGVPKEILFNKGIKVNEIK